MAGKETRLGMRQGAQWAKLTQETWGLFGQAWAQAPETIKTWSDLHLGHANIIGYAERPFGGEWHMNAQLLANAQAVVGADDWLLFVGDLAMWKDAAMVAEWVGACPGRKVLVLGNHDVRGRECPKSVEDWQALGFEAVADAVALPAAHDAGPVWITHYPLPDRLLPEGIINLHGHTHQHSPTGPHANACVEVVGYQPRPILDLIWRPT